MRNYTLLGKNEECVDQTYIVLTFSYPNAHMGLEGWGCICLTPALTLVIIIMRIKKIALSTKYWQLWMSKVFNAFKLQQNIH